MDAGTLQALGDALLDSGHEGLIRFLVGLQIGHDIVVVIGAEVAQRNILQLPFDTLHTKTVGQGGVDIHGLPAFLDLLGRGLVLHGAHIVEPVGDLDEHHTDVLGHGHEHLTQVFHLRFLGGGEVGTGQLGDAVHQLGHRQAKQLGDLFVGGVGVFNAIVEQSAQDGIQVQAHFRHDLSRGQGVDGGMDSKRRKCN